VSPLFGQEDPAGAFVVADASVVRGELFVGLWLVAVRVAGKPCEACLGGQVGPERVISQPVEAGFGGRGVGLVAQGTGAGVA
jgi:hypothetical protein